MRTGVRLGIDVGKTRVGLARSDLHGMLATPVETIARASSGTNDIDRICALAEECDALEVVVGLPLNLRGDRTPSTEDAEEFAQNLAARGLQVRLVDERFSTVSAQSQLHSVGRNTRQSRAIIDQAAAVIILQHALDSERPNGREPGRIVVAADLPLPPHRNEAS